MKINLNAGFGTAETSLEKSASARSHAAATHGVSETAAVAQEPSLNSLSAAVLAAPEIRQQRVEALQGQLASRTYQVSSSQIASSLLDAIRVNH